MLDGLILGNTLRDTLVHFTNHKDYYFALALEPTTYQSRTSLERESCGWSPGTCGSEGVVNVQCLACWSRKQSGSGDNDSFSVLFSRVMALWFPTMHSGSSANSRAIFSNLAPISCSAEGFLQTNLWSGWVSMTREAPRHDNHHRFGTTKGRRSFTTRDRLSCCLLFSLISPNHQAPN